MSEKQPHIQLSQTLGLSKAILVGDPARLDVLKALLDNPQELAYNREFRSIKGTYQNTEILGISTGIGAPSCAIAVEELAQIGIKQIIRVGSAGAYQSHIGLGDLIIAQAVVRHDGLTPNYAPIEFPAIPDLHLLDLAQKLSQACPTHFGIIRSHDGFYMDNNAQVEERWSALGVLAGDMESGAVLTVGRLRHLETLSILNNVVLWKADVKEGINALVGSSDKLSQGQEASLKLALNILAA